ncbi:MHYT domain-containing protein [Antribacter gilvus]|uniref:MHYT domain-containing protein n=1 Tax=Antribacter gilvus TaxID=2304675 RepID=UPI0013DECA16|nr:MHYT domain-containing protein [Antribacter gilvus]
MIDHFSTGYVMPAISFVMSCLGCGVGLAAIARAHIPRSRYRVLWLVLGGSAIGATGVWAMHFVALLGLALEGARIRYDVAGTIMSLVVGAAALVVGAIVADGAKGRNPRLLVGAAIAGLGLAASVHLGMGAIQVGLGVSLDYAPFLGILSYAAALLSALLVLWFANNLRSVSAGAGAMVLVAAALSGVHYIVMSSMSLHRVGTGPIPPSTRGMAPEELVLPIAVGLAAATLVLMVVLMALPSAREIKAQAKFDEWRERNRATVQQPVRSKLL